METLRPVSDASRETLNCDSLLWKAWRNHRGTSREARERRKRKKERESRKGISDAFDSIRMCRSETRIVRATRTHRSSRISSRASISLSRALEDSVGRPKTHRVPLVLKRHAVSTIEEERSSSLLARVRARASDRLHRIQRSNDPRRNLARRVHALLTSFEERAPRSTGSREEQEGKKKTKSGSNEALRATSRLVAIAMLSSSHTRGSSSPDRSDAPSHGPGANAST